MDVGSKKIESFGVKSWGAANEWGYEVVFWFNYYSRKIVSFAED